ncbi:methyl-accepting chemotaxis sensory transducer [Clostridium bornimense]|uniref:Methyl-accepting chemotaxis sensory transducer n=1 Tax=Clostridium bornimense TaxID=1216932 RepID=W6RXV6_9CLOT|nr:methyl-accepting chemotaxis protein [Clostridium bornimense]CDM69288.1 methyl-accepting chemotaxis sensory transducer [Clostridium bornimense]
MDNQKKFNMYANKMNLIVSWILAIITDLGLLLSVYMGRINPIVVVGILSYLQIMLIVATVTYRKDKSDSKVGMLSFFSLYIPWVLTIFASKELIMYTFAFPLLTISALYAKKNRTIFFISLTSVIEVIKIILDGIVNIRENLIAYIIMLAASAAFFITLYIVVTVIEKYMRVSGENLHEIMKAKAKQEADFERNIRIAQSVSENSNIVSNLVEEIKSSTEAVTCAIEEIAQGASTTAEDIQSQSESVEEIQSKIEGAVEECNIMDETSNNASEVINEGTDIVQKLTLESNIVTRNTEEVAKLMGELQDECEEIASIISVIQGIAKQTNLLALNASIEAARAGEMGKGFSVVANEVGTLAGQCSEATKNISDIINNLQQKANKSTDVVSKLTISNNVQNELVNRTEEVFNKIDKDVESIILGNEKVKSRIIDILKSNDVIVKSITNISAISEETMSNTEETLAMSNENITQANETNRLIKELVSIVNELIK